MNYGYGPQKESKSLSFERTQYQETAAFGMNYAMKAASMIFDGAVGYMLTPSLGVELGASMTSNRDITETLDASIPHPLWMSYPREGTIDGPDLKLNQIDLYLNAVYSFRFSKLGVSLFAGPCYLMSTATIVTDVATEEKGYPYMNLDVIQTASEIKSNAFGFDAGAAVSFSFGRMFDVFLDARYIMGKGAFKPEGDLPELELNLGGFRAGGGLKLRF